jgi:hypothetical protein
VGYFKILKQNTLDIIWILKLFITLKFIVAICIFNN